MAFTREQAKEKLISFGITEPTDEQINTFLNDVHSEAKKEKEKAEKLKEDADRAKELEKELEALKNQNLSEEEKKNKELAEAMEKIAQLQQANILSEVKAIFGGAGLAEDDYKGYLNAFTTQDLENAKSMAQALVTTITNTKEQTEKAIKEQLLDQTKGGGGGGGSEEKTDDVKLIETLNFGGTNSEKSNAAKDYYK